MRTQIILLLAILFITFDACKKEKECVNGNGDIVQESRDVGNFKNVTLNGAYEVSLNMGAETDVDLFGESNILPLIQTEVSSETLVVKVKDDNCYNTNNDVEVSIASPDFEQVTFNGSGNIKSNNLVLDNFTCSLNGSGSIESGLEITNDFTLNISGAGDATVIGNGKEGHITITGEGSVYANNFMQESVYITISGSGDVRVYVTKLLDVTITGSGSVYYEGNPETINTKITGTGVVEPL